MPASISSAGVAGARSRASSAAARLRARAGPAGPPCRWGSAAAPRAPRRPRGPCGSGQPLAPGTRAARPPPGAAPASRHHVGHQPLVARARPPAPPPPPRATAGMAPQRRLDLPGLDAEAPHLDLVVDAAQELELAVRQPARQVARAVQPRPRARRPERDRARTARPSVRPVQIAPGQPLARRCTARPATPTGTGRRPPSSR